MKWTVVLLVISLLISGCGGTDAGESAGGNGSSDVSSASGAEGARRSGGEESTVTTSQASSLTSGKVRIDASDGGSVEVEVEVADDTEEMARGLMERTTLAEDAGMLFVYPEERELSFWMKDTLIPLSIAFMDSEGRIVDIQDMKALDDTPPHYASAEPARYALEVNKGFFDERGVEVGDMARLPV
jgi:uncharacterized membrane protein (UPF0127 family)